jgi:hypothetical protein
MHQLVRDGQALHRLIGTDDTVEGGGVGIVVACDLLREQLLHHRAHIDRVGQQAEQRVGARDATERLGRQLLGQLGLHIAAHLLPVAERVARFLAERETDGPLHLRGEAVDESREGALAGGVAPLATAAGHQKQRGDHRGETAHRHSPMDRA